MEKREFSFQLPASPEAASQARRALDAISPVAAPEVLESARLLVSELVTNSVRHVRPLPDSVGLRLRVTPERLRAEVIDNGPGFHGRPEPASLERVGGWGLNIVDQVADRWGVDIRDKVVVWFEIDRPYGMRDGSRVPSV